jgi:methyl-accepting chemotaxis protein
MWFEDTWNIPLYGWLLVVIFAAVVIITALLNRRKRTEPVKENMDHFCRCYARGEISRDDFEELKKDLQNFKRAAAQPARNVKHELKKMHKYIK